MSDTVLWFSCGAASAVACKIGLERWPDARIVYQHIASAHPDNERFISDCERWYGCGIERIRSQFYADQFHVIQVTRFISSPAGARCTTELKKKVRRQFERDNPEIERQVFGFTVDEKQRSERPSIQQIPGVTFPLIEAGITKRDCYQRLMSAGIALPAMYRLGFSNNNCIGCVKGGAGYWNRIRVHFPQEFQRMAELEREVGHSCIKGKFLDELRADEGRHIEPDISCDLFCMTGGE